MNKLFTELRKLVTGQFSRDYYIMRLAVRTVYRKNKAMSQAQDALKAEVAALQTNVATVVTKTNRLEVDFASLQEQVKAGTATDEAMQAFADQLKAANASLSALAGTVDAADPETTAALPPVAEAPAAAEEPAEPAAAPATEEPAAS